MHVIIYSRPDVTLQSICAHIKVGRLRRKIRSLFHKSSYHSLRRLKNKRSVGIQPNNEFFFCINIFGHMPRINLFAKSFATRYAFIKDSYIIKNILKKILFLNIAFGKRVFNFLFFQIKFIFI